MGVYDRGKFFWMHLEGSRPPIRISTGVPVAAGPQRKQSEQDAETIYRAAMGDLARGTFRLPKRRESITFAKQAAWYFDHVSIHHRSRERERSMIRALVAVFGETPLNELTIAKLEEWKSDRAKQVQPVTVNREIDILKPLMRRAVPVYLDASPADKLRKFRVRTNTPITILDASAEDAILKVASPAERAMFLLGLDALLRFSDVRTLRAEHDRGRYLDIVNPKTTPYKVPVSTRLRAALDALEPQGGWYFPRRYAGAWQAVGASTAHDLFTALCARAGVPVGRKAGGITFHGLRHTGATRAARVVKLTVVRQLGGWSSLKQLERYDHPEDAEIVRAVEAIGQTHHAHAAIAIVKNTPKKRRIS